MTEPSSNPTCTSGAYAKRDLVSTPWSCAIWCACGAAFVAGFSAERWRPVLWIAGLGIAGALCVANAVRCRRLHCYITGPVFLAGALLTALNAAGITHIPWTKLGWGVYARGTGASER
ncbi:MAG: hypothetical protein ACYC92_11210 [Candidatus Acidiferrales bacterium]